MSFNINPFVPKLPDFPIKKEELTKKSVTSGSSRLPNSKTQAFSGEVSNFKPVNPAAVKAETSIKQLLVKTNFRTFNNNADSLKKQYDWKEQIKYQLDILSMPEKAKLASMNLYDVVDRDREVIGHILNCLQDVKGFKDSEKSNLNLNIKNLKTLIIPHDKIVKNKKLGGGAVNTVYLIVYKDSTGKEVKGVFKPDPSEMDVTTQTKERIFGVAKASGIREGDDAHLTARSVASFELDKLLFGENDPIGVKTEYVILNGQRGIMMELAEGGNPEPAVMIEREIDEDELESKGIFNLAHSKGIAVLDEDDKITPEFEMLLKQTMGCENIRYDDEGNVFAEFPQLSMEVTEERIVKPESKEYQAVMQFYNRKKGNLDENDKKFLLTQLQNSSSRIKDFKIDGDVLSVTLKVVKPLNMEKPETANGLLRLQVFDWITGQVDRHPGNYFIDPASGAVKAIDNDCSFGVNSVPKDVDVREQSNLSLIMPNNGSLMLRMPTVVTQEIKDQIINLYLHEADLRETLNQYISKEEIDATIERLNMLTTHVQTTNCKIVEKAEDLLLPENLMLQDSNNSYYLRERDRYRSKSWNDLRINPELTLFQKLGVI